MEYYFDHFQWMELKMCVDMDDMEGVQSLIRAAETRHFLMIVSQAEMILDHKYFNKSG
jgi:hypothetical protein